MPVYPVAIAYLDDVLRAVFDCPLCKIHVAVPFSGGRPSPEDIIGLHLGGSAGNSSGCTGISPQATVDVEKVGAQTAVIRVTN